MVRIGTAGWVIPRQSAAMPAGEGSHLERYARVLKTVPRFDYRRVISPLTPAEEGVTGMKLCVGPSALWFFASA